MEKRYKYKDYFQKWGFKNIKLNTGFAEIEFEAKEDDQTAAWEMYVELLTRIATQPLDDEAGDEETALDSIYSLFATTRNILKEKGRSAPVFTKIAIIVLNQVVRPFTAKWHKKKLEGCFDFSEEKELFRKELICLQYQLKQYSKMLADLAMVEDLTDLEDNGDEKEPQI